MDLIIISKIIVATKKAMRAAVEHRLRKKKANAALIQAVALKQLDLDDEIKALEEGLA